MEMTITLTCIAIHTLALPIGRQKLESSTSAETGNDSPYLENKNERKM